MTEMINLDTMIADFSADLPLTKDVVRFRRDRIMQLERHMQTLPDAVGMKEFNEGRITHHFATGVYGRELFIPKGQVIVSKIHRGKTLNFIAKGVISVISEKGYHTYTAPHVFVSDPFTKRVVISHEDTVWITAHGSHETDLDKIEDEIIAKDFSELMSKQGEDV
jgi:hypothetical protein